MTSDFETFRSNLENELTIENNLDIDSLAQLILDEYSLAVSAGGDPLAGNAVVTFNDAVLFEGLKTMFNTAFNTNAPMNQALLVPGLVAYWTGAILDIASSPPGTTSTVSNVVTVPGVPVPQVPPGPGDSVDPFIDFFVNFFQPHLTTIAGTLIAVVPGSPPVSTPFPWIGYL